MIVGEIIKQLEDWAPPGAAWEKDNVGLQTGSRGEKLKNILLCLELDEEVLKEALQRNCNLIITHHPLIFNPLKKIDFEKEPRAQLIRQLIKKEISVYSAHTNLDFTKEGVSFRLAKSLRLQQIRFLAPLEENQYKVAVFTPADSLKKVAETVFDAGGGIIGEYENCSFTSAGKGTFKGSENSNPKLGKKGFFTSVDELKFEFIVNRWNLQHAIAAMLKVHPYEEPAYDIIPLKNKNVNYGAGAIGSLANELSVGDFLTHVSKSLKIKNFRYAVSGREKIKTVAVCGGAGANLIERAINAGANAFVTADLKYHEFQRAKGNILLIDGGHYETEIPVLDEIKMRLEKFIGSNRKIKVWKYSGSTNPVKFYKH